MAFVSYIVQYGRKRPVAGGRGQIARQDNIQEFIIIVLVAGILAVRKTVKSDAYTGIIGFLKLFQFLDLLFQVLFLNFYQRIHGVSHV